MIHDFERKNWTNDFYDKAVEWWGENWYDSSNLDHRYMLFMEAVGSVRKEILELGAGTGETSLFLSKLGNPITIVEKSRKNVELLRRRASEGDSMKVIEGDYYDVDIPQKFDVICMFESFGFGNDTDQRFLLKRISNEWLKDDGCAVIDIYHPYGPIKYSGTSKSLEKLQYVKGSVDMTEYTFYDTLNGRWIDIWEPVERKEDYKAQSVRCYTPADLLLLLEGTGLKLDLMFFRGELVKWHENQPFDSTKSQPFTDCEDNYNYTVKLIKS